MKKILITDAACMITYENLTIGKFCKTDG